MVIVPVVVSGTEETANFTSVVAVHLVIEPVIVGTELDLSSEELVGVGGLLSVFDTKVDGSSVHAFDQDLKVFVVVWGPDWLTVEFNDVISSAVPFVIIMDGNH